MSMKATLTKENVLRPVVAGSIAAVIDRLVLKRGDIKSNVAFGATVGLAVAGTEYLAGYVPIKGSQIGQRLVEITSAVGATYVVNRYVMKSGTGLMRLGAAVVVSDVLAEFICDYAAGRPISFMQ